MKKIIITGVITLSTLTASFAQEILEVTNLNYSGNNTIVTLVRKTSGVETGSQVKSFENSITMQQAVTKSAYLADEFITVTGKGASSTTGQVNFFAKLRYDAWFKGLNNYFLELTRQLDLAK